MNDARCLKLGRITNVAIFTVALVVVVMSLTGCASLNRGAESFDKAAENYYNQDGRDYATFAVTNVDEWTMKGSGMSITTRAPHKQLSIMQPNESLLSKVVDKAAMVGAIAVGADALKSVSAQGPTVVESPPPLIVRPEVIQ